MNRIYHILSKTLKEMGNVSVALNAYESLPTDESKKKKKKKKKKTTLFKGEFPKQ